MGRVSAGLAALVAVTLLFATRADAIVVWTDGSNDGPDTIGMVHRDGSGFNQTFIVANRTGNFHARGIAVGRNHIYWTNGPEGTIGRANLDGTNANPNFISTAGGSPLGLTTDSNFIYWANAAGGTIGRAKLDGTNANAFWLFTANNPTTVGGPTDVAVDASHIYWTNTKFAQGKQGTIGRAPLSGKPATQDFISGIRSPTGLAVNGDHIYWTNYNFTTQIGGIGQANLDGGSANQDFVSLGEQGFFPYGLDVGSNHLYYAMLPGTGSAIGRVNLDGTNLDNAWNARANPAWGVAVTPKAPAGARHR